MRHQVLAKCESLDSVKKATCFANGECLSGERFAGERLSDEHLFDQVLNYPLFSTSLDCPEVMITT